MRRIEMTLIEQLPADDLERLSAYIDGELSQADVAELEARLSSDPDLRRALLELRSVVNAARSIPAKRLPRSFILSPEMVSARRGIRFPVLQLASALSALAFVVLFSVDLMGTPASVQRAIQPAGEAQMFEAPAEEAPALAAQGPEAPAEGPMLDAAGAESAAEPEQAAPLAGEGELETGAMKYSATPLSTIGAEMRAAADEALALATATAPMVSESASDAIENRAEVQPEFSRSEPSAAPGLSGLRISEIALASLSLSLAALSLILRRRSV
jgi:anti-sigma factor RsiW